MLHFMIIYQDQYYIYILLILVKYLYNMMQLFHLKFYQYKVILLILHFNH